jgi:aminoglycoside phosphotransferase (APT) family kinase protein
LRTHIPISEDITLVHGDFKPGNTLIENAELAAVLDWETAHLGDPIEDLGWVTNPLRASEHQIPGRWEVGQMVNHYRVNSGRHIDPDCLRWWGVFGNFKLLTIWLTGLRAFLTGIADRPLGSPRHHLPVMLAQLGPDFGQS